MNGHASNKGQVIYLGIVRGISHGHDELLVVALQGQQDVFFTDFPRDQRCQCLRYSKFSRENPVDGGALFNDGNDGLLIDGAYVHENFWQDVIGFGLDGQGFSQNCLIDDALLDQQASQLASVIVDETTEPLELFLLGFGLLFQALVLTDQVILLQCQTHGQAQVVIVPGLGDELVNGPIVDSAHDGVGVCISGEHDSNGFRISGFYLFQ